MNREKLETINVNPQESSELIAFHQIKTPQELLEFMQNNVEYGFVGKDDNELYSPKKSGWGIGDSPEELLQNPEEILKSKHGTCMDQTELERAWFLRSDYEFKTFFLVRAEEISQKSPGHVFLAYNDKDKWFWFENTMSGSNGIHEFDSVEKLIKGVEQKVFSNALHNGLTEEELKSYRVYEFEMPEYGIGRGEFVERVINKKSLSENLKAKEFKLAN